jgi:phytoene synthase
MSDELKSVIARLLAVADGLYARARSGVAYLPLACRPAILAAGLIYAEIGRALEALSHDSVSHRAHVPTSRKVQLLTKAVAATPWLSRGDLATPLPAVAFLIEAGQGGFDLHDGNQGLWPLWIRFVAFEVLFQGWTRWPNAEGVEDYGCFLLGGTAGTEENG